MDKLLCMHVFFWQQQFQLRACSGGGLAVKCGTLEIAWYCHILHGPRLCLLAERWDFDSNTGSSGDERRGGGWWDDPLFIEKSIWETRHDKSCTGGGDTTGRVSEDMTYHYQLPPVSLLNQRQSQCCSILDVISCSQFWELSKIRNETVVFFFFIR